jgi:hypothetical protein
LLGIGAAAPLSYRVFAIKMGFTLMPNNANALFGLTSPSTDHEMSLFLKPSYQ